MTIYEQLENSLIDQIQKLNDDSVMSENSDEVKVVIEKSKAISDLSNSFIDLQRIKNDLQRIKNDEKRIKIEAVKVMHEVSTGMKEDNNIKKYLGIESDETLQKNLDR